MNRDRGTIKWNAMMLPEHVKYLREWKAEDFVQERPQLEDWMLQELFDVVHEANRQQQPIELHVWCVTYMRKVYGRITKITQQAIYIEGEQIAYENICGYKQ